MAFMIKRVYDPPAKSDGTRVLVDRLWPRGLTKAKAQVDLWLKGVAPSTELRQWFHKDPTRWREFKSRYRHELADDLEATKELRSLSRKGRVTIVYGARDPEHNHAIILLEYLKRR